MTSHNNRFPMLSMKCQFMMNVWCVVCYECKWGYWANSSFETINLHQYITF